LFTGFSCYRPNMGDAIETLQMLKTSPGLRVAGGFGPTFHTDEFLGAGFDLVIRGEAEASVVALAKVLETGSRRFHLIPGASFLENGKPVHCPPSPAVPLDGLSFPARDTLPLVSARRSASHVSSSRGCMARCLFCSVIAFQREAAVPRWRARSAESVASELQSLFDVGVRHVKVVDDSFLEPPRDFDWCVEFADRMAEMVAGGMTLRGSIRADRVTRPIASELRRAGFVAFSCGIENFSDRALRRMNKSSNAQQNLEALEAFDAAGIFVQMGMILFDHDTSFEELLANALLLDRFDHIVTKGIFTEMYAAEGTNYTKLLRRQNRLLQSESIGQMNSVYRISDPKVEAIYKAVKYWHKTHVAIYDRTIDPVSAPKALSYDELRQFMRPIRRLRTLDNNFFSSLLEFSKGAVYSEELIRFTNIQISESTNEFARISNEVDILYQSFGMSYDAVINPFLG
jgi:anaerobic magnesium-protoporphyrin IX monomethyl ester cyclase